MCKFLATSGFKWKDPKLFDSNNYTTDSSKTFALETDHEYPKEFRELHNDYPFAEDKVGTKINVV